MFTKENSNRRKQTIERDPGRVICRLHMPGGSCLRAEKIIRRILSLSDSKVEELLSGVIKNFYKRHKDIERIFDRHYRNVSDYISFDEDDIDNNQKLLIGACFTMEYAVESAALFNPSIVLHPNQSGLDDDCLRFIMSLRAVGEGHISSIVFRSGIIDEKGNLNFS